MFPYIYCLSERQNSALKTKLICRKQLFTRTIEFEIKCSYAVPQTHVTLFIVYENDRILVYMRTKKKNKSMSVCLVFIKTTEFGINDSILLTKPMYL